MDAGMIEINTGRQTNWDGEWKTDKFNLHMETHGAGEKEINSCRERQGDTETH